MKKPKSSPGALVVEVGNTVIAVESQEVENTAVTVESQEVAIATDLPVTVRDRYVVLENKNEWNHVEVFLCCVIESCCLSDNYTSAEKLGIFCVRCTGQRERKRKREREREIQKDRSDVIIVR